MVIHASWFTELALRFAISVSKHFDVVIVLDRDNFDRDCRGYIDVPPEVRCVLLPGLVRWRNLIRYISLLLRYRPDVIQLEEDVGHKHKLRGFMLASRWFAPTVWRVHDPHPHSGRDADQDATTYRMRDLNRRDADLLIAHGSFCSRKLETLAATPVFESMHGVIHVPLQHRAPARDFLMIGRMEAYKGIETLVEALTLLRSAGHAFTVTLAGQGPELDRLQSRLEQLGAVILNKRLTSAEIIDHLQDHRAVVLPYKDATQSGIVAAAFGNHRPVIASKVGGLEDVVIDGENGLFVPPEDPKALAGAMQLFATDDKLQHRLGQGARKAAEASLNWDHIGANFVAEVERRFPETR